VGGTELEAPNYGTLLKIFREPYMFYVK